VLLEVLDVIPGIAIPENDPITASRLDEIRVYAATIQDFEEIPAVFLKAFPHSCGLGNETGHTLFKVILQLFSRIYNLKYSLYENGD